MVRTSLCIGKCLKETLICIFIDWGSSQINTLCKWKRHLLLAKIQEGSHPFPSLSLYRSTEIVKDVSHFYHINCGVLQEFSALKKPRTTREKKTLNFSCLCLISPVSCWHVTHLWCHSVMFMNELQSLHLFSN